MFVPFVDLIFLVCSTVRNPPKLVLAIQAIKPFEASQFTCEPNIVGDMLIELALKTGNKNLVNLSKSENIFAYSYVVKERFAISYMVMENPCSKLNLFVSTNPKTNENSFSLRDNSSNETLDIIPPNSRQIFSIICPVGDRKVYSYNVDYYCMLENKQVSYSEDKYHVSKDVNNIPFLFAPRAIPPSQDETDKAPVQTAGIKSFGCHFEQSLDAGDSLTTCWARNKSNSNKST